MTRFMVKCALGAVLTIASLVGLHFQVPYSGGVLILAVLYVIFEC